MTDDGELSPSPFDRPLARAVAGAVFLAAIAALVAIHWEDIVPPPENASLPLEDAVERCIAQRSAEIEQMLSENPEMEPRRALFLDRVAGMCQATAGSGNALPPPPPRLPAN